MAVLPKWIDWRERAKIEVSEAVTATFDGAGAITRGSGSFVTAGFEAGMWLTASGTASNDGQIFVLDSVSALSMSVTPDGTAEAAVACTLTAYQVDPDGVPQYPGAFASTNKVDSGAFTGLAALYDGVTFQGVSYEITCNGGDPDSTKDTDEFDWYLSQHTDVEANQWLALTQKASTLTQSFSGSVVLSHTALATSELGVAANTITVDAFVALFRHAALYVRRRSDGAIQWIPLRETMVPK